MAILAPPPLRDKIIDPNAKKSELERVQDKTGMLTRPWEQWFSLLRESLLVSLVQTGMIVPFGGTTAPTGFLLCNGAAVSRVTYLDLFTCVGTAFGVGDGSTTFNLPDLRGRFPLGKATAGTGSTLGGTGGALDHVHTGPAHTHDAGTLAGPSHTHTYTGVVAHVHRVRVSSGVGASTVSVAQGDAAGTFDRDTESTGSASGTTAASGTGAVTGATASGGTGNTGGSNPAFQVVNYVIKT